MAPASCRRLLSRPSFIVNRLLLVILSLSALRCEAAGNIDVLEPIVRSSPALAAAEDFFGYSVTLHQVRVPTSFQDALESTRIIVGAPRGTFPGGLDLDAASTPENQTGLVYDCPVSRGSCGRLGDGTGLSEKLFDPTPNVLVDTNINSDILVADQMEVKSQQLMGATVISSGDRFLACAPRFSLSEQPNTGGQQNVDTRSPVGRCFVSPRSLTGFVEMRPCVPEGQGTVLGPNRCVAGTSAVINNSPVDQTSIVLGTPGDENFRGTSYLFQVNSTAAVLDSSGTYTTVSRLVDNSYEGYAMTVGNITGRQEYDYILSAPRANGSDYMGSVVIRQANNFFNAFEPDNLITGTQVAEYFGWSLAAADLNGDGYDELLVGAPLYSNDQDYELGRVYVFKNTGGSIMANDPIILNGDMEQRSRFGTSITRLGDVNDDGYEDVAVGAPYQPGATTAGNTGKIFIYYGSENFVGNNPNQTISADEVVNSVSGLDELMSFGWTLSSGVDVDNNEYRDLLVGAYETGIAVLFRAKSVARIDISVSTNLTGNQLPIDLTTPSPAFNLQVCASFSGRGLTESLATILNVNEVVASGSRRLLFEGSDVYQQPFVLTRSSLETCQNITVTIRNKNSLYSSGEAVGSLEIRATLTQEERVIPAGYDGNPANLTDLRSTPILVFSGNDSTTVTPLITCAGNAVCRPDLDLTIRSYTFISNITNKTFTDVVAGSTGVDIITVELLIQNGNLDAAIGSGLNITMPTQFTFSQGATTTGVQITCELADRPAYTCNLPNFIAGNSEVTVRLTWRRRDTINGNEATFTSRVAATVPSDTDLTNNADTRDIGFSVLADLAVTTVRFQGIMTYNAEVPPSDLVRYDQLGSTVTLTVTVQNRGPSILSGDSNFASLNVYIPTRDSDSGSNFYLYPGYYTVTGTTNTDDVLCDDRDFNVNNLRPPLDVNSSGRKKRSSISKRQSEPAAQDSNTDSIPADSIVKNCSFDEGGQSSCQGNINCTIRNWETNQPFTITIFSYLDRRFFSTEKTPFTFIAFVRVSSSARDDMLTNNRVTSAPFILTREVEAGDNTILTIVVPIVAVVGALILIVGLFCLLYFLGFFKRKKYGDEPEGGDFEVRELPPEETANGNKSAPPANGEAEGVTMDNLSDKEHPPTPPHENDIGDVSDLQDGEKAAPEGEPDETSL